MDKLIKKAENTHFLNKDELIAILADDSCNETLFKAANRVREEFLGDEIHLRGIIEFSNICRCNCAYCGLRRDNTQIERYRLEPETIIEFAQKAVSYGYKTIVLQSGEDNYYSEDKMVQIIKGIKKLNVALTLSIGEKSYEEYKIFKEAGADRFLLRIETTDEELYKKLHYEMSFENRKKCLLNLRELGYEVGTGCLIGLPDQSFESLASDILFFKELNADMIGLGPFIPNKDTPLKDAKGGAFELSIKVMALTRLLLPDINIPATTAMETLNSNGRVIALQSGANVVMPNVTEETYKKKYKLYPGKVCVNDTFDYCMGCITEKIMSINRFVSKTKGFRAGFSFHSNF